MKKTMILGFLVLLLLQSVIAAPLIATISNPQVTVREITQEMTYDGVIQANNKNDFPVTITVTPPEELASIQFEEVILAPGEKRDIPYSISPPLSSGSFSFGVMFTTTDESAEIKSFGVSHQLTIILEEVDSSVEEKTPLSQNIQKILIGIVLLLLIVAITMFFLRGRIDDEE